MQRRKYPRFSAAYNADCSTASNEMLLPCRIVDISEGGSRIALFSKETIAAGSTIELHIELPNRTKRLVTQFKCLWSQPAKDAGVVEGNVLGGCFLNLNTLDRKLLLKHAHAPETCSCSNAGIN